MNDKRRHYLADGDDRQTVLDFFKLRNERFEAANQLAQKLGGIAVTAGWQMSGVVFDGEPPADWRWMGRTAEGKAYYMPSARSKVGKQAKKEIQSIRIPGASDLHSKFTTEGGAFGEAGPRGGYFIRYITAEVVGGKCIIHVPDDIDVHPPHSKLLKKSEYWAIKEAASEAA